MFAWKLPAGTGTFECYVFCIDYGLVWSFPTSLAMPPDSTGSLCSSNTHLALVANPFPAFTEAHPGLIV